MAFFCASFPSVSMIYKYEGCFMPFSPLYIAHLPCFKILQRNHFSTSKLVHANSTSEIDRHALKTTLS